MKNRTLAVLMVVLVAQLVLTVGLSLRDQQRASEGAPETLLASIDTGSIDRIELRDAENTLLLERTDDRWTMPGENGLPADGARIASLMRRIDDMAPGFPVARRETSQAQLKVSPEEFERVLTLSRGDEVVARLYLGTSSGLRESHVRVDGETDVYATRLNSYQVPVRRAEWIDKWAISVEEFDRIEGADFALARDGEEWKLDGGDAGEKPLEAERITDLVETFQDLAVLDLGEPEDPDALEWKTYTVEAGDDSYSFRIAGDDKAKYARRDDIDFLFRINDGVFETLDTMNLEMLATPMDAGEERQAIDDGTPRAPASSAG